MKGDLDQCKLLNRHEVADLLQVSLRTVDQHMALGNLRVIKIGRSVRVRMSALDEFLDAREEVKDSTSRTYKVRSL